MVLSLLGLLLTTEFSNGLIVLHLRQFFSYCFQCCNSAPVKCVVAKVCIKQSTQLQLTTCYVFAANSITDEQVTMSDMSDPDRMAGMCNAESHCWCPAHSAATHHESWAIQLMSRKIHEYTRSQVWVHFHRHVSYVFEQSGNEKS